MVKVAVGQMTAVGDVDTNFATCANLAAQSQKVPGFQRFRAEGD
jgi:hypothetical protein